MSRLVSNGKRDGIDGGQVDKYFRDGKIKEIAKCCETDVVNTYRVWLRYELFRGRLTEPAHQASELNLIDFIKRHETTKQHLRGMIAGDPAKLIST
jgi:predicted PolB exonuclease-like 3'-5' exonuclease